MKYSNITLGRVEAVWNKLGGEDGVERFLRDELVVKPAERIFQTWKTIKLGTGLKTADDFRNALKREGMKVDDRADDLLGQKAFTASESEKVADLVVVSLAELGFKNRAKREDIYKRAQELGLDLCPAEVGPQLRLQYKDQPKGEWLLIAMEPITDSAGDLHVFDVERGGHDLWLRSDYGFPEFFWIGNYRWVFLRRK